MTPVDAAGPAGRAASTVRGRHVLGSPLAVVAILVGIVASLAVSVAVVAGVASGVRTATRRLRSAAPVAAPGHATVTESMSILTANPFGPRYTHTSWTVRAGETVVVEITSYDDGAAPLTGPQTMYDAVLGTVGGTEVAGGKAISSVPNGDVSHTFTVVGLGLNLPIPAAPTGKSVTVVARFVPTRTGTFTWQCYAPCGSGSNAMGGPMSAKGWMEGRVRVLQ